MKLKVGDKIYVGEYSHYYECAIIKRVTKTQAISKKYRFCIDADDNNGYCKILRQSNWSRIYGTLATPELDIMWANKKLRRWFSDGLVELSLEQINKIKEIIGI